ncbi:acyl-CoA synthetase [Bordetella avium]|uniref:AMP-binding protein n=1 Tax=Bordetella avium TaxID=521 RepID=UPI000FDB9B32|nr:AMP-binding protein [Bordetella avium]AZY47893.1 acyl-CoA synthetase [Bordetella avium]
MDFYTLLQGHAAGRPAHIAFQDQDRVLDYAGLLAEVDRLAALMQEQGVRRGDRLALWMPNCIEWLVTFLACARLGVTVIAVNTRFREHEVGQLLARGRCTWMAMWPAFKGLPFVEILQGIDPEVLQGVRRIFAVGENTTLPAPLPAAVPFEAQAEHAGAISEPGQENDGALVYTTSGTTSAPKLVLHRQAGLIHHGHIAARAYGISADSVVLLASPMCGAFGFSTLLGGLTQGATLVSLAVFDAARTARQILEHGVTHTFANNEFLDLILKQAEGRSPAYPSLRYVGFASFSPAMDDLPERALQAGMPIAGLYGSSELQALVAGHTLDTDWRHRRVAGGTIASPEGRVRAVDSDSGAVLPHGAIGQIEIKAPSLMSEYLDNPEATRKAISDDGYFRTGDLGYTVHERLFIFQGRDGDHLRLGGFLVAPLEIEQFLEGLPGVAGAQVVGAQREGKTVPVAFVRPQSGVQTDERAIIGACQSAMAKFKVPQRVIFVEDFPMVQSANSNKVQKHVLRQQAQAMLDGQ